MKSDLCFSIDHISQFTQIEKKPAVCTDCGKGYNYEEVFCEHIGSIQEEITRICNNCEDRLRSNNDFKMHVASQHETKKCLKCKKRNCDLCKQ